MSKHFQISNILFLLLPYSIIWRADRDFENVRALDYILVL